MSKAKDFKYIAYIDESGDEGFGKLRQKRTTGQSRWLSLGAVIVSAENDKLITSWRNEIMNLFPKKIKRDLHFRYLNHTQRVAACKFLAGKPLGICVIASNKKTLLDNPKMHVFKQKGHLYNYLVRFLLERITDTVARKANGAAPLQVVFSRRSGTDYQSMREYLLLMKEGKEVLEPLRSINWDVLDPNDIKVENHSVRAGLQIADVVTSATHSALEPNQFGDIEPRYGLLLKNRYIRQNKCALDCGLTLIPPFYKCPLTREQKAFIDDVNKKGRPSVP